MLPERERNVVVDVEVGEEGAGLEEDAHPLAQGVETRPGEAVHDVAADQHPPAVRPELAADELEQGGLPHPARPEHRGDLASRHGHVEGVEDRPRPPAEGETLDGDQGLGRAPRGLSGHGSAAHGGYGTAPPNSQGFAGSSAPSFLTGRRSVRLTPRARAATLAT